MLQAYVVYPKGLQNPIFKTRPKLRSRADNSISLQACSTRWWDRITDRVFFPAVTLLEHHSPVERGYKEWIARSVRI